MTLKTLLLMTLCAAVPLMSQTHFTFTSNTGSNAIVGIQVSIAPTIDGAPIAVGDEIGAFTPAGLCVGGKAWTGSNIALTVWGDNNLTPAVDGIRAGETIMYRIWKKSSNTEYLNVAAAYSLGDGIYAENGLYSLSSLQAVTPPPPPPPPAAPTLLLPVNNALNVPTRPTVQWSPVSAAVSYTVECAADTAFANIIYASTDTTTARTLPTLAEGVTYSWHVRSVNGNGSSEWSTVFHFTTLISPPPPPPATPTLLLPANGAVNVPPSVTLRWSETSGATQYLIHVALDSLFTQFIDMSILSDSTRKLDSLTRGATYYWRVRSENRGGMSVFSPVFHFTVAAAVTVENGLSGIPAAFMLAQNYPNPFNPATTIRFTLPAGQRVRLAVYDILGREVTTIVDGYLSKGDHAVEWSGAGRESGMYVYRLTAGTRTVVRTMLLTK
jgi:hypothetical protein